MIVAVTVSLPPVPDGRRIVKLKLPPVTRTCTPWYTVLWSCAGSIVPSVVATVTKAPSGK